MKRTTPPGMCQAQQATVRLQDDIKPVSHWLLLNVTTESSRMALAAAMRFLTQNCSSSSRVSVLPLSAPSQARCPLSRLLHATSLLSARVDKVPAFLQSLAEDKTTWKQLQTESHDAAVNGSILVAPGMQAAIVLAESSGLNSLALKKSVEGTEAVKGSASVEVRPEQHSARMCHASLCVYVLSLLLSHSGMTSQSLHNKHATCGRDCVALYSSRY
jgi:hypothetical protein